jgi:hypothetical protein
VEACARNAIFETKLLLCTSFFLGYTRCSRYPSGAPFLLRPIYPAALVRPVAANFRSTRMKLSLLALQVSHLDGFEETRFCSWHDFGSLTSGARFGEFGNVFTDFGPVVILDD